MRSLAFALIVAAITMTPLTVAMLALAPSVPPPPAVTPITLVA